MDVRFCILGSGSSGNAALILTPHARVLVDAGFSPEELTLRMKGTGASWEKLDALVLTHTHGDHLKRRSLRTAFEHDIPFYCHAQHIEQLAEIKYLRKYREAGLVHVYEDRVPFEVAGELLFHPVSIPHDSPPTFGFRIETADASGAPRRIGYFADLGHWTPEVAALTQELDLLALEFNHDEELERNSGRHPKLIQRVLSDLGHLSNRQAALAFEEILRACPKGGPRRLIQLHLSSDCNRPELAFRAAQEMADRLNVKISIFSTRQDQRGALHVVGE